MLFYARGSETEVLSQEDVREALCGVFETLGSKRRVLAVPPDFTRFNSLGGEITAIANDYYGDTLTDILPALGTHSPMTEPQMDAMFPGVPRGKFRVHDWRGGIEDVGEVPADYIREVSEGKVEYSIKAQVNRLLLDPGFDLILSIGQVVPHEVVGMANHAKNIFVGVGGVDFINKSHYLGASYGMERLMGRAGGPVRAALEYARTRFIGQLPIIYILTVRASENGRMVTKGLFVGDDFECFEKAVSLSRKVNFVQLDREIQKCVVYLDPAEFKSTWLGNKAIYRTRMALADDAQLLILAPALCEFGEDAAMDALIRRFGYRGTPHTLAAVASEADLRSNLGAAAHLIHGSSEGRFNITYAPGHLTKEEIESVGFNYAELAPLLERYRPGELRDGWNTMPDGEEIYFISNPALGLWAYKERFKD
ncbi:MAG: DUF2088 domain-containing protein [Bacteroidales bacterium]|nr:DUF2088 domain-containing protein [Bacteroidales bacterium]